MRRLARALLWVLCVSLIAAPAVAQYITGTGNAPPAGGAVGGSCTTVNALLKRADDQTIGCSAVIDASGALTGVTSLTMAGDLIASAATAPKVDLRDTGLAVGITAFANTTTYFQTTINTNDEGGASLWGFSSAAGRNPMQILGLFGSTDPTDTIPAIWMIAGKRSGTSFTTLGAAETVLQVAHGTTPTPLMTILGSGNTTFVGSVTAASFQGIVGSVTPAAGTFTGLTAPTLTATSGDMTVTGASASDIIIKSATGGSEFRVKATTGGLAFNTGSTFQFHSAATLNWNADVFLRRSATKTITFDSDGGGTALTLFNVIGPQTVSGAVIFSGLTTASGTPSSICQNASTKEITVNAALTCTVSSRRFKDGIVDQDVAWPIIAELHPRQFRMKDSPALRVGFIAEEVEQVDPRLVAYDGQGRPHSVRYEDAVSILTKGMQELEARLAVVEERSRFYLTLEPGTRTHALDATIR